MLRSLHMKDVGPAARFDLELGERLNVLTGDNGLGKSFVLDVAWWVLTGTWVARAVLPRAGAEETAEIGFQLYLPKRYEGQQHTAGFRRAPQGWEDPIRDGRGSLIDGRSGTLTQDRLDGVIWAPVIYARADGAFSVWDPARNYRASDSPDGFIAVPRPYHFDVSEVWDGLERDGKPICNGLIQDWTRWQLEAAGGKPSPFELLRNVLGRLSHPSEPMTPGEPRRLYLDDVRDYPTIDLPYGNVPIAHLSAGMRRIVSLAYLIAWTWSEHEKACQLLGRKPAERIVFLADEVELHLHPQWQRHIVPRLMDVLEGLGTRMQPQVLMTTHSPMVLASLEPHFDMARDKLFLFELSEKEITLRDVPWTKRGDAASWLTSPVFGLEQARSPEAEKAIEAAYDYMAGRHSELPQGLRTDQEIDRELRRLLPDQDKFWPRWIVYQERKSA
jgi:putative AbiEii toxin of type IV toxin-antitoxin system